MQEPEVWTSPTDEDVAQILRRQAARWALVFAGLIAAMGAVLWWSSSAVHFSTSRIGGNTRATHRLHGIVRDSQTGMAVPWAEVYDDPAGNPPLFRTSAGFNGEFDYLTIAERHHIRVAAIGYNEARIPVGKQWFLWMPKGEETLTIRLDRQDASRGE